MRYSSWEDIYACERGIMPEIETTAQSNSHLTTTTMRFCWGFTRLHDVFLFQIAPKWNEWVGSHSNSLPMLYYCDFKGLPLNVRILPSSNVLPRSSTPFLKTCSNLLNECIKMSNSIGVKNAALSFPVAMATGPIGAPLTPSFYSCGARTWLHVKLLRVDQTTSNQLLWNGKPKGFHSQGRSSQSSGFLKSEFVEPGLRNGLLVDILFPCVEDRQ